MLDLFGSYENIWAFFAAAVVCVRVMIILQEVGSPI